MASKPNADRPSPLDASEVSEQLSQPDFRRDVVLTTYLERIGHRLRARCDETNSLLKTLHHDSLNLAVQTHNLHNTLALIADAQFLENRVYDDDEQLCPSKNEGRSALGLLAIRETANRVQTRS